MAFRFDLQPNRMAADPAGRVARVKPYATLYLNDILHLVIQRGTLVTPTDALAVITLTFDVISDEVARGNAVLLSLMNLRPGIKGKFLSLHDSFDPARHTPRASIKPGALLKQKLAGVTAERIAAVPKPAPTPLEYRDVNTQALNSTLTSGGIGQLRGERLKFNLANSAEGLFFIDGSGNATQATVLALRTEKRLLFEIPATLAPGAYALEVHRAYGKAAAIRTGRLNHTLTVA